MTSSSSEAPGAADKVESALREAGAAIEAAQILLGQGTVVDLKGLEQHVEQACADIPSLSGPDRDRLKPTLVSLIDALNALTDQMARQHREITEALQGLNARQRAAAAYKPGGKR